MAKTPQKRLQQIADMIEKLKSDGLWTQDQFNNALALAKKAAGTDKKAYAFVMDAAPKEWRAAAK